jgi:hypothetical protein
MTRRHEAHGRWWRLLAQRVQRCVTFHPCDAHGVDT